MTVAQSRSVFGNDIQPISIVVMLDTSGGMSGNIGLLRESQRPTLHPSDAE